MTMKIILVAIIALSFLLKFLIKCIGGYPHIVNGINAKYIFFRFFKAFNEMLCTN